MSAVADVASAVRSFRFVFNSEDCLQAAIAYGLESRGFQVEREVRLGEESRIDLLVDGTVGLEVKIAGRSPDVEAQCLRYLAYDQIEGLVLVTARVRHTLPVRYFGKPLEVVTLRGGLT